MTFDKSGENTQPGEVREIAVADVCPSFDTLSSYFDGELPDVEMRSIRLHVASCPNCAPIIADFRSIHSALNSAEAFQLPRSFVLTDAMTVPRRPLAPVTPIGRFMQHIRNAPLLPFAVAVAALLLVAVIAGDAWSGRDSNSTGGGESAQTIMIGGVEVPIEDNAEFGAASAGTMNNGTASSESATSPGDSGNSIDWFNWWRPFELVLGLTVAALIVTMMSRRRPRHE